MSKDKLSYLDIQTPQIIWEKLLLLNPIGFEEYFFEPFAGEKSLYNLIPNLKKEYCEINENKDIFDYDFKNSNVTTLYTNPPFKAEIPDKKGNKKFKNCVFYFLEMLMTRLKNLKTIGFLINAKSFCSLTPIRLSKLERLGFSISNISVLNTDLWWGCYYFVVFQKEQTNKFVKVIEKTFLKAEMK